MLTFLFGSGADTNALNNLKSGNVFAEAILKESYKKEIELMVGKNRKLNLINKNSTKIYIQTICSNLEEARKCISSEIIENIIRYNNDDNTVSFQGYIKPICKDFYGCIFDDEILNKGICKKREEIKNFFYKNAILFDALDGRFNSLRNIDFNADAKKVLYVYYSIFVLMIKDLYDTKDLSWDIDNVFKILQKKYYSDLNTNSYYSSIKDLNCNVVTTNYTDIAKLQTNKDVIYLHGKLTWFEDLKNLTIYDIEKEEDLKKAVDNKDNLVPFIMIPSGIKPMICRKQIEQFMRFANCLDDTDILIAIGYNFNSEDNHINSIIAEWLRKENSKLLYFDYNNSGRSFEKLMWCEGLLGKIRVIPICEENAISEFNKVVNEVIDK